MTPETLAILFAVGTGISIGWVLHVWHAHLNPTGIQKVAHSAAYQVQMARDDAKLEIERCEKRHETEKQLAWQNAIFWRQHSETLAASIGRGDPRGLEMPPTIAPPAPSHATNGTNGVEHSAEEVLREQMLKMDFAPEHIEAILTGNYAGLPPDGLLSALTVGMMQEQTGTT